MSKKLIAVLAVLFMITTSVAVVGYSENAVADEETALNLDDITTDTTSYWVKGIATTVEGGKAITLSNNTDKTAGGTLSLDTDKSDILFVFVDSTFTLPENKEICGSSLALTIDREFTFKGTISGKLNITTEKNVTFDGATIGNDKDCVVTLVNNAKLLFKNQTVINGLEMMDRDKYVNNDHGLYITNAKTNSFWISYSYNEEMNTWNMGGTLESFGITPIFELGEYRTQYFASDASNTSARGKVDSFLLDNLHLSGFTVMLTSEYTKLIMLKDTREIIDYRGNYFVCDSPKVFETMRNSTQGEVKKIIFDLVDGIGDLNTVYAAVGFTEITGYYGVNAVATEGIKSIDTPINFVEMNNNVIDLTKINVTCEDGYHFDGWYYTNADGIPCKILNPSQFTVTEDMYVYASAKENAPAEKDYSGLLIGLIVVGVLILLLGCAAFYMRYFKKA